MEAGHVVPIVCVDAVELDAVFHDPGTRLMERNDVHCDVQLQCEQLTLGVSCFGDSMWWLVGQPSFVKMEADGMAKTHDLPGEPQIRRRQQVVLHRAEHEEVG